MSSERRMSCSLQNLQTSIPPTFHPCVASHTPSELLPLFNPFEGDDDDDDLPISKEDLVAKTRRTSSGGKVQQEVTGASPLFGSETNHPGVPSSSSPALDFTHPQCTVPFYYKRALRPRAA